MDIEFVDPAEVPLPPDQVSFQAVAVEPYSDGTRVKVNLSVTPFQERPSIDIEVLNQQGARVASSSIVEATDTTMSLTLHIRAPSESLDCSLVARILNEEQGVVDKREVQFTLPRPTQDS